VWFGVVAVSSTPRDIVTRLNSEINKIIAMPDVRQRFVNGGVTPVGGTLEQFTAATGARVE
jgi:tripartite-type tricarboxylate transporter receptor subunit TctC